MQTSHHPTPQQWRRARAVFDACAHLPAAERARRIASDCEGDAALRLLVEALLRSSDLLGETRDDRLARGIAAGIERVATIAEPGERVGAFRIVRELARGGMGVVYLAERDDGTVAQRVALKFVGHAQLGPDAALHLAREYRLLAALEHPAIARLIDAGTREDGSAWFAMEYVEGRPLTRHCDELALPLRARLALFLQVCAAVQYAHAHLIVHRDLKAANILVRADGLPKLLDFGIATSLGEQPAPGTTGFLSPQVAAPEQFHGSDAGVATDVYALGVLLCELVAGRRPIEFDGLAPDEAMRRVAEAPPRLPSEAADDEGANRRGLADARALRRRLEGDLDAIAARCLEKDPQRRYASVAALADDVARHLERRPLAARAGERGHRARRFLQRNALAVALGALVLALVVGFGVFSALAAKELARQRDTALQREREAKFQQSRAQSVSDFLVGLFKATTPEQRRGHDITVRTLLERGRADLDRNLKEQPDLRASMLAALSDVYFALDDLDGAEKLANEALALREHAATTEPASLRDSLVQMARLDNLRGRRTEALDLIRRARELPLEQDALQRAELLSAEAEAREGLGNAKEAVPLFDQAFMLEKGALGIDNIRVLRSGVRYSQTLDFIGRQADAERLRTELLPHLRRNLADDDPALAETLRDVAMALRNREDYAAAEPVADEALAAYVRIYGEAGSQTASAMNTVATIAQATGHVDKARRLMERALAIRIGVFGADSTQVASAEYNLGLLLQLRTSDARGALDHLLAAERIGVKVYPDTHGTLTNIRLALGSTLRELGCNAAAEDRLREALVAIDIVAAPRGVDRAIARGELACSALLRGPDDAARRELDAALALIGERDPTNPQGLRLRHCAALRNPGPYRSGDRTGRTPTCPSPRARR